jgi:hypothetical protein
MCSYYVLRGTYFVYLGLYMMLAHRRPPAAHRRTKYTYMYYVPRCYPLRHELRGPPPASPLVSRLDTRASRRVYVARPKIPWWLPRPLLTLIPLTPSTRTYPPLSPLPATPTPVSRAPRPPWCLDLPLSTHPPLPFRRALLVPGHPLDTLESRIKTGWVSLQR